MAKAKNPRRGFFAPDLNTGEAFEVVVAPGLADVSDDEVTDIWAGLQANDPESKYRLIRRHYGDGTHWTIDRKKNN